MHGQTLFGLVLPMKILIVDDSLDNRLLLQTLLKSAGYGDVLMAASARVASALNLKREMDTRKDRERELAEKNRDLEQALREVKVLRGFIPICASCKKIRDDKGYWQQIETYIQQRSEALFSHGICKDCMKKLYPDYADE